MNHGWRRRLDETEADGRRDAAGATMADDGRTAAIEAVGISDCLGRCRRPIGRLIPSPAEPRHHRHQHTSNNKKRRRRRSQNETFIFLSSIFFLLLHSYFLFVMGGGVYSDFKDAEWGGRGGGGGGRRLSLHFVLIVFLICACVRLHSAYAAHENRQR